MRLNVCVVVLLILTCAAFGCAGKRKASIEGHVANLGMVDQSGVVVQLARNQEIVTDATTGSGGGYSIDQIDPGDYEVYIKDNDPGPGTFDSLTSSTKVRWRRSPTASFMVEGGLVAYPPDLTRYTLCQARLSSGDTLAGLVFDKAANGLNPLIALEDSADIFVKRNGDFGIAFGTTGYSSIIDIQEDSLEIESGIPASGYQETFSFVNTPDCVGRNYCVRCRNGNYAKVHIFGGGTENGADSLGYSYITVLSFYLMTDTTDFPEIPPQ